MSGVYCTLADVRARLGGDLANIGPEYDGVIAAKCDEVTADINRRVSRARGISGPWSFLADAAAAVQKITLAAGGSAPTAGNFTLSFGGYTTGSIAFNAAASAVQTALLALTSIGSGNAAVAGSAGGPYLVTFGGSLTGPQARITGAIVSGFLPANGSVVVEEITAAVAAVPSKRIYSGIEGGSTLLRIDDCVSVSTVELMSPAGTVAATLTVNTDFVAIPTNGGPITGLRRIGANWPDNPAGVRVGATWGMSTTVPYDVREAAVIEVIRSRFGDSAGNTDVVGVTPFGGAQISKAFSSKLAQLVNDYRFGGGFV